MTLSEREVLAAGEAIAERVAALEAYRSCRTVAVYAATAREVPTRPLWVRARADGKRALVARVREDEGLEFAAVAEWEELRSGRYGALAPPPARPAEDLDEDALILVPGLAFDRRGHRLGRGGGHYDRLLARVRGSRVGVAFAVQVFDAVPIEAHDQRVEWLVTETGCWRNAEQ